MSAAVAVSDSAGRGRISLHLHGQDAVFSDLSYCYPLKLLSPRVHQPAVAIAYVLSYGGGLVSGDRIHLEVLVRSGTSLLLLTQGSTKVFKHRLDLSSHTESKTPVNDAYGLSTVQRMDASVESDALLILLPDPVTCFLDASYSQVQTFRLETGASAVILDWITSGRMSRGEEWDFVRYYSLNEVWLGKRRISRDALLLEHPPSDCRLLPRRSLKDRMNPYACYATVFLYGPRTQAIAAHLTSLYRQISVFQRPNPDDLIWSVSELEGGSVVRVAGKETELVKNWLQEQLKGLAEVVGRDAYGRAFV